MSVNAISGGYTNNLRYGRGLSQEQIEKIRNANMFNYGSLLQDESIMNNLTNSEKMLLKILPGSNSSVASIVEKRLEHEDERQNKLWETKLGPGGFGPRHPKYKEKGNAFTRTLLTISAIALGIFIGKKIPASIKLKV